MAIEALISFYMDEHVPTAVSEGLRRRGTDVLTAQEAGMRGAFDDEHLTFAVREARTIDPALSPDLCHGSFRRIVRCSIEDQPGTGERHE